MASKGAKVDGEILRRLETERWERALRQRARKKARRRSVSGGVTAARQQVAYVRRPGEVKQRVSLVVPVVLDLRAAHEETCNFVHEVVQRVRAGQRIALMFEQVETVRASGLLYLLSAIHRMRLERGDNCVTGTYPNNERVEQQLAASGFYNLLNVRDRASKANARGRASSRYIKFKSEQALNAQTIAVVRDELLRDDMRMPLAVGKTIFRALSEAMTNVRQHAYGTKAFSNVKASQQLAGRWWMFASLNVPQNRFSLLFYDAGVGIPKTLPRTQTMEQVGLLLSLLPGVKPNDGQMIAAAMAVGRSRTGMSHRGKGLLDLARLIDYVNGGELRIYSRQGALVYRPGGSQHSNHRSFVEGTLIEWRLPLKAALETLPGAFYGEGDDSDA